MRIAPTAARIPTEDIPDPLIFLEPKRGRWGRVQPPWWFASLGAGMERTPSPAVDEKHDENGTEGGDRGARTACAMSYVRA